MFEPKVQAVIDKVNALREQVTDHWQIPADEALLLAQIVRAGRCMSLCEIGTSYGFSTLHLAAAAGEHDGWVHTIDISEKKRDAAADHLAQAGLSNCVTQHLGDARQVLAALQPHEPFDFVFIDAVKEQSHEYLEVIWPKLAPRAILITDNTTTHAEALADFVAHLRQLPNVRSAGVAVGNGFEFTVKLR